MVGDSSILSLLELSIKMKMATNFVALGVKKEKKYVTQQVLPNQLLLSSGYLGPWH
ncbi:unnamed protein product [Timema podura]|uniref:Uncharacterized protein n=1 Tax=Timema podura TaxID=61482 RepID=A0ABN7PLG7_TIMPD|nr:unnamed protein product [Timema podura]